MVAIHADESLYAVRWLFRIFPFRKLYLIPQVFSASHIPQNTRGQHSAFRNPHSAKYSCPSQCGTRQRALKTPQIHIDLLDRPATITILMSVNDVVLHTPLIAAYLAGITCFLRANWPIPVASIPAAVRSNRISYCVLPIIVCKLSRQRVDIDDKCYGCRQHGRPIHSFEHMLFFCSHSSPTKYKQQPSWPPAAVRRLAARPEWEELRKLIGRRQRPIITGTCQPGLQVLNFWSFNRDRGPGSWRWRQRCCYIL